MELINWMFLLASNGSDKVKTTSTNPRMWVGLARKAKSLCCNLEKSKISLTKFDNRRPLMVIISKFALAA